MKINSAAAAALAHAHQPPAKAARDLLASRADLEGQAFGQIVSKLVRGEEIPVQPTESTEPAPADTATAQSDDTVNVLA